LAVYDDAIARTVVFNGMQWELAASWTFVRLPWPAAMLQQTATYDVGGQRLIIHGKTKGGNETWAGHADGTWTLLADWADPKPPVAVALASDPTHGVVYAVGGPSAIETWTLSGSTWQQRFPAAAPPWRSNYRIAYDVAADRLVLFGGRATTALNDTWVFN